MLKIPFFPKSKPTSKTRPAYNFVSCSDCVLYNFVKSAVTGDPSWIGDNYETIVMEYADLTKDTKQEVLLSLAIEIQTLTTKLDIIELLTASLMDNYDPVKCDLLRKEGFIMSFTLDSIESDLKRVATLSKTYVVRLANAKEEYGRLNKTSDKPTEQDFEDMLIMLSRYMKYRINSKDVTVSEYCGMLRAFKRDNKKENE